MKAVYIINGFLESGKTTFIQSTLQDERFNKGENTLIYANLRFSQAPSVTR